MLTFIPLLLRSVNSCTVLPSTVPHGVLEMCRPLPTDPDPDCEPEPPLLWPPLP